LPFFGPSTIRDTAGLAIDGAFLDPMAYMNQNHDVVRIRNIMMGVKVIDKRAQFLPGSDLLDEAALDPYAFVRDAYLQRRNNLIHDGNVPQKDLMLEESEEDDGKPTIAAASAPAK
jgi:phospholipid-binding lipoprotein MlaA